MSLGRFLTPIALCLLLAAPVSAQLLPGAFTEVTTSGFGDIQFTNNASDLPGTMVLSNPVDQNNRGTLVAKIAVNDGLRLILRYRIESAAWLGFSNFQYYFGTYP